MAEQTRRQIARQAQAAAPSTEVDGIRERCKSLAGFVKEAWHVIEPGRPLIWNWHLDAICRHLEAITFGEFQERGLFPRLIINVPPGSSKSTLVSVMWQAWEWSIGRRSNSFLTTSYGIDTVLRDNGKTRTLLRSEWYRSLWPQVVLSGTGLRRFMNTDMGVREGSPFNSITGKRADRFPIDDPHSTKGAESIQQRASAIQQFREGGFNRLNDQGNSAMVIIMQRLHENDLTGTMLREIGGFVHLMLPMRFEPERKCITPWFEDPRTKLGELLDPLRFPDNVCRDLEVAVGQYAWAGQYQQRPSPREGGLFKRAYFEGKIINTAPIGTLWVRHWDLAATSRTTNPTAARSAGVKIGRMPNGKFLVGHSITEREEGETIRTIIKATAQTDGKGVTISLPQDPGQAGKVQKQDLVLMLAGWRVFAMPETGSKESRAEPFATQCEAGNVFLLAGEWNTDYIDELCLFPGGRLRDQVDASSGAFGRLLLSAPKPFGGAIVVTSPAPNTGGAPAGSSP